MYPLEGLLSEDLASVTSDILIISNWASYSLFWSLQTNMNTTLTTQCVHFVLNTDNLNSYSQSPFKPSSVQLLELHKD